VNLNPQLLEILACPACKSPLEVDDEASELVCTNTECGLAYPVRDDIPVLLVDEARKPAAAEEPADEATRSATAGSGERMGNSEPSSDA
jgi:uncharacterized protein YbaR (Trm112 family)